MSPLQAVLLGVMQGITEFIPVSSSGHLVLVPMALGWDPAGLAFNATVHIGTLLALVAYLRAELLRIVFIALGHRDEDPIAERQLILYLVIATVPAGLVGFFLESTLEPLFQSGRSVGIALLVTAALLYVGQLMDRRVSSGGSSGLPGLRGSLVIGVAQAFAVVPGLSRSGSTIAAGLAIGLDREASTRFSLLLAIPIVAGAGLFALADVVREGLNSEEVLALTLGGISAAIAGYLAIGWLVSWIVRRRLVVFAGYCAVLGILTITLT